jgi:hypothetical protein
MPRELEVFFLLSLATQINTLHQFKNRVIY